MSDLMAELRRREQQPLSVYQLDLPQPAREQPLRDLIAGRGAWLPAVDSRLAALGGGPRRVCLGRGGRERRRAGAHIA